MRMRKAQQILKSLADDTRLRIINLLGKEELNVTQLCKILGTTQSNLSKHLARLRLTGVVGDRREGLNVYYYLAMPENRAYHELINAITKGLTELEIFKKDVEKLNTTKRAKSKVRK